MGSFFLLVIITTGAIGVVQHYANRPQSASPYNPQFLPHPWNDLPRVSDRYGEFIEKQYPPLLHERVDEIGTSTQEPAIIPINTTEIMPTTSIQTPPTTGPTDHQPRRQPTTNHDTNREQTDHQPQTNQSPTVTPTFDPREDERPGEFEFFQALIRINQWSPTGKDILRALWKAQPNTARYQPGIKRRNQFANRLKEHSFNEQ